MQGRQSDDQSAPADSGPGANEMLGDDVDAALDARTQEKLGKIFRSYCDDLINEPVPDTFLVLLAKLEAKEQSGK
jgi:hypothetical protein